MQLLEIQTLNRQLSEKRRQDGAEACQQAYALLAVAIEQGFSRREDFKQAIAAFAKAIRSMRSEPEPYVGMGYVLLLMRDYPRAERYLLQARRLGPNHPDVQALLTALMTRRAAKDEPEPAGVATAVEPFRKPPQPRLDPDQLFEMLQAEIQARLKQVMHSPPPAFGSDAAGIESLRLQEAELSQRIADWNASLAQLDAHFELSGLRKLLGPLEIALRRYVTARSLSEQALELKAMLEAKVHLMPTHYARVHAAGAVAELADMEALIEQLEDECDSFADQLDALEAKGFKLEPLLWPYKQLLHLVEQLGEELDDKLTELGKPSE